MVAKRVIHADDGQRSGRFRRPAWLLAAIATLIVDTCLLPGGGGVRAQIPPATVQLVVDASEAPRKIFHAQLVIPASPGPLVLYYPAWIPGEHGQTGPINDLVGLTFTARGTPLPWRRDLVNMYAFHMTVPQGVNAVEARLDYVDADPGSAMTSAQLAIILWHRLLLYPKGWTIRDLTYQSTLRLPAGWKFGTALPIERTSGDTVQFQPATLETLVDSPVLTGLYYRPVELAPGQTPPHEIDLTADSPAALQMNPELIHHYERLVAETGVLFGGVRHYRDYHFLVALSDHANPGNGLEHHESSDIRLPQRALVDPNQMRPFLTLLPHEFTHSWNGKYRRPAGMVTSDYNTPMTFDLLWVYEGLTEYLGEVLTGRSGLCAPRECRDELAWTAARMDHERGRTWRSLQDTVDATSVLQFASDQWGWWRRRYTSVYDEGVLIWLEVDTIIRQQTGDKRSIDDFSRLFYGGTGGRPAVSAYTFDDVVDALGRIAPYGWRGLLNERLTSLNPRAPLGGLENGGWRLVYDETPNPYIVAAGEDGVDLVYSIGVRVDRDGTIADVVPGSPADNAGVVPGMKLVGVDGRQGAADLLREAVRNSRTAPGPLILELTNGNSKETHSLDYHSGARYPHLARIEGRPDMLTEILRPHAQEQK